MTEPGLSGRARLAASVIVGRNDILFHRDHEAVEQVSGRLPFTPEELAVWTQATEARAQWCAKRGIVFRFLIVPEKHVVYADKLPDVVISENRPAQQLLRALSPSTRLQCSYPVEILIEARRHFPTYYQFDTHWTQQGAFAVYSEFMTSLQREVDVDPITDNMVHRVERPHAGDLGIRLEPERDEVAIDVWHKEFYPFRRLFENHGRSRGSTITFESDRMTAPRFMAFRDSFLNYFIPHIIPVFSKSLFVSSIDMHFDAAEAFKPDIILFEVAERFLGYHQHPGQRALPEDRIDVSFESFSGVSLNTFREWG
jgi:alginate O-acetyltransferase complex protein AlgJ